MKKIMVLLLILSVVGCGYSTKGFTFKESKIIIVPVVNAIEITSESRQFSRYETFPRLIENKLTNEVIRRFNVDGHLKVVSDSPDALKLACMVNQYSKEALRYEDDDDPEEQRLRLYVQMTLHSPEGTVLINRTVVGESSYFLSGSSQKSEILAQDDLVTDTARRISEAVLEEW